MFVRVKTTPNSPRRSVQVVQTSRVGDKVSQRIVRHMGIALDASEEAKLRLMAQEYIDQSMAEQLDATSLFATQAGLLRRPGRPARQTLASVSPASGVNLGDVLETARRIEGPHEVLGHLYDYLRFDRLLACAPDALAAAAVSATASAVDTLTQSAGADSCVKDAKDKGMQGVKGVNSAPASGSSSKGTAMLRDLVIARVMAPASKHESARALEADYGKSYTSDSLYRLMDAVYERLDSLKRIVFEATASLVGGHVDLMLFDITTLYFESVQTDELRAFGYSKDQKYHCTQVVLALATNEDGLPIGYELFAGNTAEVKTLIACMQSWQTKLAMGRVSFVADRALCSKANLDLLEQGGWSYVVAMPLRRSLKQAQQAQILQTQTAVPKEIEGDLLWVREFDWLGRRLIVTYSSKRAHKDQADRQALVDKLTAKLGKSSAAKAAKVKANTDTTTDTAADTTANANKAGAVKTAGASKPGSANAKKLITNSGYLKYIEQADTGGVFVLDEDKLLADSAWDGLHAIVTNDTTSSASALLTRYRRLWVIEDSFRLIKHNLAIRPIYHFKPERIKAHIGICFLAFALLRHAQQRIKLAQGAMSTEQIKRALHGVQASVLTHKKTHAKYRLPSSFSHDAGRIYKAFGLSRSLDADVLI
jgi:transposase